MTVSTSQPAPTLAAHAERTIGRAALAPIVAPAVTILLSSFLLFLVQPILAKQILPWFGGSAGVWTICLVFFQVVLLLGYAYAHWLTSRGGARQYQLHSALLLVSCLTLPIIPGSFWKPGSGSEPTVHALGLLCTTVGLPYFLLASTAPLLQRWLGGVADSPGEQRSIYRLFALSNLGSLLGLLSYPFTIEPFATVRTQALVWSSTYVLFVAGAIAYAWRRRRMAELEHGAAAGETLREAAPSLGQYGYWIGCAALGSTLLLSVTNQLTQNVASIPMLWIVPLSAYLLSFVICFEGRYARGWYERRFWVTPTMLAAGAMAWALFADNGNLSLYVALPIFIVGLLLGCVVCHGELARSKPDPAHLTHFYLSLAAGGAVGGMFVGLVAPQLFNGYWELPLALLCLAGLGLHCCREELRRPLRTSWKANLIFSAVAATLILLLLGALPSALDPYALVWAKIVTGDAKWGCAALLLLSALLLQQYRLWRAVALTALLCTLWFSWGCYRNLASDTRFAVRNFYGTLRVTDDQYGAGGIRRLKHGIILHGSQIMEPAQQDTPTTYFSVSSGIGRTLLLRHRTTGPLRIGSVGLGAGTLAAYGQPGDVFRTYELNPAVLAIAESQFTYLKNSKARVETVLGDARLSLEREIAQRAFERPEQRFDVLSLDAFSGDAIPVHLLTAEAFAIYVRVIKPDGVIAFHLTNRYLNLPPVVEQIARAAGFQAVLVADRPRGYELIARSDWVLVTRNVAFLREPEIAAHSSAIVPRSGLPVWTDQFTNLLQILK